MNLLIVEDNDIQLQSLYKILSEKYTEDSFTYMLADNYDEAIRIINTNNIDIFILDIALSDNPNGGIDIARFIRFKKNMPYTPIIFITSIATQITTALNELHCCSYIYKPYKPDDVYSAFNFCIHKDIEKSSYITLQDINSISLKINFSDIYFIEADSHILIFYTKSGRFLIRNKSMDSVEQNLPDEFVRCHRKYIVCVAYVTNYDKTNRMITISTVINNKPQNFHIGIGKKYKDEFEERY